jgi:lipid-binding SYLF domain-containing protein
VEISLPASTLSMCLFSGDYTKHFKSNFLRLLGLALAFGIVAAPTRSEAASRKEMEISAREALIALYKTAPSAAVLAEKAKGILVFPGITKGGFIVGGQYGEGTLFVNDQVSGFYNTAAASFGLQAGVQKFGYAMFFMNDSDMKYLKKSEGWEIGVGPSITIVDAGIARSLSSTTAREGVYAFFFEQKGLMAGLGLQGTKISEIHPKA